MKRMLMLFILCFSFSFAGTVWVAAGVSPEVTFDSDGYSASSDLDGGGLEIGYTHMFSQDSKLGWGVGGSYHIVGMSEDGDYDYSDFEAEFLTIYGLGTYALSESMGAWFGLGLGLPQGDLDDTDAGLAYSLGIMYNINESMMIGIGYTSNSCSESGDGYDLEATFTRMTLNFGYRM